jgi:predicted MPP superfamily phosphohydrolase
MDGAFSKFGFITDTHYDYKYESRKDDTLKTLLDKTVQAYDWFKSVGCDFIVHGGDMFDRHRIYNFDLLSKVRNTLKESSLTTYFIMGQHDLSGYNADTLPASRLGFIDSISDGSLVFMKNEMEIGGYRFIPCHVMQDPVEIIHKVRKSDKPTVCVCHALLTDQREAFGTISITHFKTKHVQLVLSGDLHDGVPFQVCNGIQFYNPGSFSRDAKTLRLPKVGALQWDGTQFVLEEFEPKCPDAKDIFFWDDEVKTASVIKEEEEVKKNEASYIEEFQKFHSESKDIYELLEKIGASKGIRKEVLDLIKRHKDKKHV